MLGLFAIALVLFLNGPTSGLPYRDSFASGKADEWAAFGGIWQIVNGTMHNDSDERGGKLMTGSPRWKDYSFSSDVELLGEQGDAGLIVRSSEEEQGVDSYNGYYAGLRTMDGNLVLGRANHGWIELAAKPMPGGLHAFEWYHLKVAVHGCQIAATATEIATGSVQTISLSDQDCPASGRIGLRSHSSGGVWKNLRVLPLNGSENALLQTGTPATPYGGLSDSVDEPAPGRQSRSYQSSGGHSDGRVGSGMGLPNEMTLDPGVQTIGSLRLVRTRERRVTIRGSVILNAPALYVQDATGGVAVESRDDPQVKVGDEVEVTGDVEAHDFSSVVSNADIRLLWAHAPTPPLSVTPGQAATGAYDAMFIEVDGYLTGKEAGKDDVLSLDLSSADQSFRAIIPPGHGSLVLQNLSRRSFLRLRGVCVVDPRYTHNSTPFVLLVASSDDIEVLAGPPWWSARNLAIIGLALLVFALLAYLLYVHITHWRLRGILEERERIAHEMHDTLAQSFVGIGFQLQAISNGIPQDLPAINEQLDLACELVRHSHEEARRSLSSLRREFLESETLHSALAAFAERMVEHSAVRVHLTTTGDGTSTPYRVKDALFRIGQEAIANAIRHGSPSTIRLQVEYDRGAVTMVIEDNGSGFTQTGDLRGFGLMGIRKRADGISAALAISSTAGKGTQVKVVAPVPPKFTLAKAYRDLWSYGKGKFFDAKRSTAQNPYSYRR